MNNATGRSIVHLDADAFFASVEQASDPRLRGRPVAVGGEKRGIIASASYEARKLGIYTPMPTAQARKICPQLVIIPGDYEKYERFSTWMFSYAYDFTPDVEVASIDEGYFDLSGGRKPAVEAAEIIRSAIHDTLKISVSEGLGTSKLISQIASKLKKPAAFIRVPAGGEREFLAPLENRWLPGVGPVLGRKLNSAGLTHIHQLAATPPETLCIFAGSSGRQLHDFACGLDDRPVTTARAPAKSYGKQHTWENDITDPALADAMLRHMADELMASIRSEGKSVRTASVKVRYNDFEEDQSSETFPEPTCHEQDVYLRLSLLLKTTWRRRVSLRMLSLRFSNVYNGHPTAMLPLDPDFSRMESFGRVNRALDTLRHTFHAGVVMRGHDLLLKDPPETYLAPAPPAPSPNPAFQSLEKPRGRNTRKDLLFTALHVHSHYSFLDSTLSPEAAADAAAEQGMDSMALTDTGNLHGTIPFIQAAREKGIRPIIGAEVRIEGDPVLLFVENEKGYSALCSLLERSGPITVSTLEETGTAGLVAVAGGDRLATFFEGRFYLGASRPSAFKRINTRENIPRIAVPPVHTHLCSDDRRFRILESIRLRTLLDHPHPERKRGRIHLPSQEEINRLFCEHPDAIEHTRELADRCRFELPLGRLQFPSYTPPDGSTPRDFLRTLVFSGFSRRYSRPPDGLRAKVELELQTIHDVGYEEYFLVVWDLLQSCRQQDIPWITRGSAADSLVCYCLGISDICPVFFRLDFRRFLNRERMSMNKLPDIDIDFPHDRRDHVVEMLFERFGSAHCAVVGGFSTFKCRSAFAEVAKVLGLSERQVRTFTRHLPWHGGKNILQTLEERPECRDLPVREEPFRTALETAAFLDGMPRHAKTHPCGVVLSRRPMNRLIPRFKSGKGWPTTHCDMDAAEALGLVKLDILAQGGLSVIRDTYRALKPRGISIERKTVRDWNTQSPTWNLIAKGEARAVHHIESPAMLNLSAMCNVRDIRALTAIVSVIRPGAANEGKKLSFTRRYQGYETVSYVHPSLEPCLKETFGLILYEEQVIQICTSFAGMNTGRADQVRRALVKDKPEAIVSAGIEFLDAAREKGHTEETSMAVWDFLKGFHGYAFCKAHSAAYAVEAFEAAWLKQNYPAEFMAAVLTHGKGFYPALVYVLECHRIGLRMLPPSVNQPGPGFWAEGLSIRVPIEAIKGLPEETTKRIQTARQQQPFKDLSDFVHRIQPSPEETELLLRSGALDLFGTKRTRQFWDAQWLQRHGAHEHAPWLFKADGYQPPTGIQLTEPSAKNRLEGEWELLGFTASAHPLALFDDIAWESYCPIRDLPLYAGRHVTCCGLVLVTRVHHQVTGEPMKFLTIADWTGIVQTEFFSGVYQKFGAETVRHSVLEVHALVQPFENGRGLSLRVTSAKAPRKRSLRD